MDVHDDSPTASRSATFNDHERLLNQLYSILPTADNKHLAFRLLLDAEVHMRLSLPSSTLVDRSGIRNLNTLSATKLSLLNMLNPSWHPILDECEQQLARSPEHSNHLLSFSRFPDPSAPDTEDCAPSHSATTFTTHRPPLYPPTSLDVGGQNDLLPESEYPDHNENLRSSSLTDRDNNPTAWPGSSLSNDNTPATSSVGDVMYNETEPESCNLNSIDAEHGSQAGYSIMTGYQSGSMSTYSSLLPEQHCPPFVNADVSSPGALFPARSTVAPWSRNPVSDSCDGQSNATFLQSNHPGLDFTEGTTMQENLNRTIIHEQMGSSVSSPSASPSYSTSNSSAQLNSFDVREPGDYDSAAPSTTQKRAKRVFDRPPGMPLGPWMPDDMGPFPEEVPQLKKPRKVRRAPSHEPALNSQKGDRMKVTCPKCSALVLPKSLNRHMERHSNWAEGKYSAHLYCRYCFSAYSRMDLLIRHQKTDAQCVMLQYKVYWNGRQPYLEEQLQVWRDAATRR
ncbi:hypothetical protein K439DRAFT_1633674 [Ramaria rubella]|nr:hypothetical protein K439DRAFT_1633674 [Ramaria rubella]